MGSRADLIDSFINSPPQSVSQSFMRHSQLQSGRIPAAGIEFVLQKQANEGDDGAPAAKSGADHETDHQKKPTISLRFDWKKISVLPPIIWNFFHHHLTI